MRDPLVWETLLRVSPTKAIRLCLGSADQAYPEISITSILQLSEQSMELSSALQNLFALLILTLLSRCMELVSIFPGNSSLITPEPASLQGVVLVSLTKK